MCVHTSGLDRLGSAALALLLAGALGGCSGASAPSYKSCNPPCQRGTECNPVTGLCQPSGTVTPPTTQCPGRMIPCDEQCVDPFSDAANCGACGNACGAAAECLNGHCSCLPDKHNCNNSWADGCECDIGCADTACATGTPTCEPGAPWSCGANETQKWCDAGTCKSCAGAFNCDGINDCESASACGSAPTCNPGTAFVCGDNSRYCNGSSCATCPTGKRNCDGVNDCEATTCAAPQCSATSAFSCGAGDTTKWCDNGTCKTCSGTNTHNCDGLGSCDAASCGCSPNVVGACGDNARWCNSGACQACPTGYLNCDKSGDCECNTSCSGTACTTTTACDYYQQPQSCAGAQSQWCYQATCKACSAGFFNCNRTMGCECTKDGGCTTASDCCNGTACRYKCTGGECP